ncbi:MAG: dihydroneopterin aldolase [Candidatus Nanopelagicales bacterium]|nr:dihydroneopterin aldolase [Candidatus Nanopelagicales bacterium]
MTDRISIVGIAAVGQHGVFDYEKANGQEFIVDVDLELSVLDAAQSDDLAMTVDYGVVAQQVHECITGPSVDLIETLAENIATACLTHKRVSAVDVAVHKPSAPIPVPFTDVVLRIRRLQGTPKA